MINFKNIIFVLSKLLWFEGVFLLLSSLISLYFKQDDFYALFFTGIISFITGFAGTFLFKKGKGKLNRRDSYLVVTLAWILISLVGAFPFYISGYIHSFSDAFFEAMSGFTTTGASILKNVESLPYGLLFWRNIIQWIGGLSIIVLSLAVLPVMDVGGMRLFMADLPGINQEKLHPRIIGVVKRLWWLYFGYTALEAILLYIGGLPLFDSVCISFSTVSTGGFVLKNSGITFYSSPFIEYVLIFFMFLGAVNFSLAYQFISMKFSKLKHNNEFKFYIFIILIVTLFLASWLLINGNFHEVSKIVRLSLFQTVSLISTTGFLPSGTIHWPSFIGVVLFLLMIIGGAAGSGAGGIKLVRVWVALKGIVQEIRKLLHQYAVIQLKYNNHILADDIFKKILVFIVSFILVFMISVVAVSSFGYGFKDSIGLVAASLTNTGPGIKIIMPSIDFTTLPLAVKWILTTLMLLGRLEFFTVFVLFTRVYWKH